jgi:hypothetical protein
MDYYFAGRKRIAKTVSTFEKGKISLTCTVFARWQDINSKTALCGADASFKVCCTVGLKETDSEKMKSSIEASLGIEKVAGLKSSLESEISREICWEIATTREDAFSFKAPECGRRTETIYQLIRDYDFVYSRQRFLRKPQTWQMSVPEYVKRFHAVPDIEDYDPHCRCQTPSRVSLWRTIDVAIPPVTLELGYTQGCDAINVQFGNEIVRIPYDGSSEFSHTISAKVLPEATRFIGDFKEGDSLLAVFRPQPVAVGSMGVLSTLAEFTSAGGEDIEMIGEELETLKAERPEVFDLHKLRRAAQDIFGSLSSEQEERQAHEQSEEVGV